MRNTEAFHTIGSDQLASVTGGCGQKKPPCPPQPPAQPQMAAAPRDPGGVSVTVATGAAAQQLIGGSAGPAVG
jgi:hypothetical protein